MSGARVLVAEDDDGIRDSLRYNLVKEGYRVLEARDGQQALRIGLTDLVLLDLMLPQMGGTQVLRELKRHTNIPVIVLTAKDSEVDKVVGLEMGADDYVTKPFSLRELLARVANVLRRYQVDEGPKREAEVFRQGGFVLDRAARRVFWNGAELRLTKMEFELLSYLAAQAGRVQRREDLMENVWGYDYGGDRKTVDVHIRGLREKMPSQVPLRITTVRGAGYRLDVLTQ